MNFSDLTKEQKQYIALGIVAVGALGYGVVFGLKSISSSVSTAQAELDDLTAKISTANRAIASREKMKSDFYQNAVFLKEQLESAPPEKNYYSWASKIIYSKGREIGVEIDSVDEINTRKSKAGKAPDEFRLESYSLRVTARGGYLQAKKFVENVEKDQPLVRFTGIEISQGSDPEIHDIQFFIQWPAEMKALEEVCSKADLGNKPPVMVAKVPKPVVKPEPVQVEPKPVPAPVVVAKVPKPVVKPEPVQVEPKPVPAPVKVAKVPEPVVKPEPVQVEPKPVPAPVVVAKVPKPVVKPEPVKVEPKPVPAPVVVAKVPEPVIMPEPVKVEPKPVPAPVVVAKVPEPVVKPEPVKVEPKPVPAPVKVAKVPEPVVKPEPVQIEPKPVPAPVVVAKVPEPVVKPEPVKVEPKPVPAPVVVAKIPEPVIKPEPVKVEPKPVPAPVKVAKVPEPVIKPEPVKVEPKPVPAPVVVAKVPEPVIKPEPVQVEPKPVPAPVKVAKVPVIKPEPVQVEPEPVVADHKASAIEQADELSALVASLGAHETEPVPETTSEGDASAGSSGLEAYIQQLNSSREAEEQAATKGVEASVSVPAVKEPVSDLDEDAPIRYVSTAKSAKKLEEILSKGKSKTSDSLSSFLGGLVEDINVK